MPVLGLKGGLWVWRKSQKISTASDQYLCKKTTGGVKLTPPPSRKRVNMIQNALGDNNMDKAIFYKWTKREKVKWRVLAERGNV